MTFVEKSLVLLVASMLMVVARAQISVLAEINNQSFHLFVELDLLDEYIESNLTRFEFIGDQSYLNFTHEGVEEPLASELLTFIKLDNAAAYDSVYDTILDGNYDLTALIEEAYQNATEETQWEDLTVAATVNKRGFINRFIGSKWKSSFRHKVRLAGITTLLTFVEDIGSTSIDKSVRSICHEGTCLSWSAIGTDILKEAAVNALQSAAGSIGSQAMSLEAFDGFSGYVYKRSIPRITPKREECDACISNRATGCT